MRNEIFRERPWLATFSISLLGFLLANNSKPYMLLYDRIFESSFLLLIYIIFFVFYIPKYSGAGKFLLYLAFIASLFVAFYLGITTSDLLRPGGAPFSNLLSLVASILFAASGLIKITKG